MPFPSLLLKPLDLVTAEDVNSMIGWPETLTVEYKEVLPGRDGRDDAWLGGGRVEGYARDKLFKEIVALANTAGGHVFLGIKETDEPPPTAASIKPIPRCVDLAERLARMAQSIDPPIPLLLVRGVPIDGEAGVVVFHIPPSRSAPHRSTDKDCYVRRGTESVPMAMRDIREMIHAGDRREGQVDALFERAHGQFAKWMTTLIEDGLQATGFRITAVPVGAPLELGRLYGRGDLVPSQRNYTLLSGGRQHQANLPRMQARARPLVRGVRWTYDDEGVPTYLDLRSDGTVDLGFRLGPRNNRRLLAISWVAGYLIHVLHTINRLRTAAGAPDTEYAVEVELDAFGAGEPIALFGWGNQMSDNLIGQGLQLPLTLPRLSFGPISELNQALSIVLTDIYDAAGDHSTEPVAFVVE